MNTSEFQTSTKTRIMFALTSLGVATLAEAISGILAFYIVDVKNLPVTWYSTFWFFYTIYNALNNPALGFLSDRTRSRWGRRIPYVLFGGLPYAVAFALIFTTPFDGKDNPVGLLVYFGMMIVIWEGLYTSLATGYYGLLPEMFGWCWARPCLRSWRICWAGQAWLFCSQSSRLLPFTRACHSFSNAPT
jgi:glycoside/pentoside/hexuronide:cation symporter, GPH family